MKHLKRVLLTSTIISLFGILSPVAQRSTTTRTLKKQFPVTDLSKIKSLEEIRTVVILGSGIAGLTAALHLSGLEPLVIEGPQPGGLIAQLYSVSNGPGEDEISGTVLIEKIRKQNAESDTIFATETVTNIDFSTWPYKITTQHVFNPAQERVISALCVIIAMETKPKYLNIPGEQTYWGQGVSNCAKCDGLLYENKNVAIVGDNESALNKASYLARIAQNVTIIVQSDKLQTIDIQKFPIITEPNVPILYNTIVKEISGNKEHVTQLEILNRQTNEKQILPIDGVFLATGSLPNTQLFTGKLTLDPQQYIALENGQETSQKGVYAIGDIACPTFKRGTLAIESAEKAAQEAIQQLKTWGFVSQGKKIDITQAIKQYDPTSRAIMPDTIEVTSNNQFKTALSSTTPVVIDFYAPWCGPCSAMLPIYKQVAEKFRGKITFLKVNIDRNKNLAHLYNVGAIPTFLFLDKNGSTHSRVKGKVSPATLEKEIKKLLNQ